MNQRTAMIIAAGVTAFTLAAGGAIAVTTTALARTSAAQAAVAQPAASTPTATAMDSAAVSSDEAAQIALGLAPNAQMIVAPRLVNFEGTAAYEVTLDAGKVYVDANSGVVLYAAPAQSQARVRPGRGAEEDEHEYEEHEHEEHEHDDGFGGDL